MLCIRNENGKFVKYVTKFMINGGGFLHLPDELETEFDRFAPYVAITSSGVEVLSVVDDAVARELASIPVEPQPTQLDRLEAQAMYTALLTDTVLEEGLDNV